MRRAHSKNRRADGGVRPYVIREECYGGKVPLRCDWSELPRKAPVVSEGKIGAAFLWLLIISAGDRAVFGVAEGDGKDS